MFAKFKKGLSDIGTSVKGGVESGVNTINQKIDERTALVVCTSPKTRAHLSAIELHATCVCYPITCRSSHYCGTCQPTGYIVAKVMPNSNHPSIPHFICKLFSLPEFIQLFSRSFHQSSHRRRFPKIGSSFNKQ